LQTVELGDKEIILCPLYAKPEFQVHFML